MMKMKSCVDAALCGAVILSVVFSSGCTSLINAFEGDAPNANPSAWTPNVPGENGETEPEEVVAAARPLKVNDPVKIGLAAGLRTLPAVEDVIDNEGTVTLPIIGEFRIVDMTTSDAERAIRQEYTDRKIYNNLTVKVLCTAETASRVDEYSITGFVHKRGRYPLKEGLTLRQAIIAAGDTTDFAGDEIRITRKGTMQKYSYRKIKKGIVADPSIQNGDIIEVME